MHKQQVFSRGEGVCGADGEHPGKGLDAGKLLVMAGRNPGVPGLGLDAGLRRPGGGQEQSEICCLPHQAQIASDLLADGGRGRKLRLEGQGQGDGS